MFGNNPIPPFYNVPYPTNITGAFRGPNIFGRGNGLGIINKASSPSIFARLKNSGITLSSVLTNTQKTLGVVKEAIPIIKQTGPMINNMKTMFKVANAFKDETKTSNINLDSDTKNKTNMKQNNKTENISNINSPEFFV